MLPSLYSRKVLDRQVGTRVPLWLLLGSREIPGQVTGVKGPTYTAGQGELDPLEHNSDSSGKKRHLRGEFVSKLSTLTQKGKFLPSRTEQRRCHGPVLPEPLFSVSVSSRD